MDRQYRQLAPGVELLAVRTDQFKTGLFTVTLVVPLRKETATANALIPEVLYRGSRRHPDIASLSAAADSLYGAAVGVGVRQRGESQCVSVQCGFIDDRFALDGMAVLEPAIELAGEILLDPVTENGVFRRDYVASEGANLADRIRGQVNDKIGWSIHRLIGEMCAGEPYAVDKLGDAAEAQAMDADTLWQRYQALLAQARVVFYYNGSASPERVETAVRRAFAPLMTARKGQWDCLVLSEPRGQVRQVTDVMDVTQGKLALGFRTGITMGDDRLPALLVCNALYGGSSHSKLFMNVRERMSLCYFASSMADKLKGIMVVYSGVEPADFERAREEILAQLDAVRRGEFTPEELTAAVRFRLNQLVSRRDSQGRMEDDDVTSLLALGRPADREEIIRATEQVTAEQVAQAARQIRLDTVYYLTGKEDG